MNEAPESMSSVSAALLHLPACETSNENITTGHVGYAADLNQKNVSSFRTPRRSVGTALSAASMCSPSSDPGSVEA